jgi:hypothetical protein
MRLIWGNRKTIYFRASILNGPITLKRFAKLAFARMRFPPAATSNGGLTTS